MSDFMQWLYPRYIKPYLEEAPQGDYAFWMDLLRSDLTCQGEEALEKAREFTAIHAFLLGMRTGQGLSR
ncbi:MAG: hypothetical protein IJ396_05240 [Oscillibacter sp.]|nr:hypothetical protein [Oscillibacter sp.]